jgi:hypothetical protein
MMQEASKCTTTNLWALVHYLGMDTPPCGERAPRCFTYYMAYIAGVRATPSTEVGGDPALPRSQTTDAAQPSSCWLHPRPRIHLTQSSSDCVHHLLPLVFLHLSNPRRRCCSLSSTHRSRAAPNAATLLCALPFCCRSSPSRHLMWRPCLPSTLLLVGVSTAPLRPTITPLYTPGDGPTAKTPIPPASSILQQPPAAN